MGMFSYLDVISGDQVVNGVDVVRMYWLENGTIKEEMRGIYNGYGSVNNCTFHEVQVDGEWHDVRQPGSSKEEWLIHKWSDMVDMEDASTNTGICVILEENRTPYFDDYQVSKFDPAQGSVMLDDEF